MAMKLMRNITAALAVGAVVLLGGGVQARAQSGLPYSRPDAVADLRTDDGAALVAAQWKYADATIVEVDHRAPGHDLKASGGPVRTNDVEPKAGAADFDDSAWQAIAPSSLEARRGNGRLSFGWYRLKVTIPEKLGRFPTAGAAVYFEIVVDDYAEVYVNGRLPQALGGTAQLVRGWNAANRVLLTRNARPGEQFQIAVFATNGPLSHPPENFVWVRCATLDFYAPGRGGAGDPVATQIKRLDPALDRVIAPDAKIERLADGFGFTEGPVWQPGQNGDDGSLLFSDPNNNTIYRWSTDGEVSVFRTHSGYAGPDIGEYRQPGSNGLQVDPLGRVTINEHGNRRVSRIEKNGTLTVLADRYEGKRLNSPNDLVYRADGALFFTDPAFGLPRVYDDPGKELPFQGVYMLKDGRLKLLVRDLKGPNGIALSPDERQLYVGDWDDAHKVVMRYDVSPDGSISNAIEFANFNDVPGDEAIDGVKVDTAGNVYVSAPGGLWILAPDGRRLGVINGPQHPHNMAFGDADDKTLYLAAQSGLYRFRTQVEGVRPKAAN